MYRGLMKLVFLDPFIAGPVFDLLWPHFLNFYSQVLKSVSLMLFNYIFFEICFIFKTAYEYP